MVPRVGQRIGPYEILGRLGSGGMGLVFSAWDARLQRDVAIKLLREEYATPTMRSRFLQEARAASGLNHPNICTVFDIGEVSGDPFLVMELLKGETLRAHISRSGRMSPDEIHRVASEVLDALVVAHARGIIHRDIKPANIILVNKTGGGFQAKVLDFGLAKVDLDDHEIAPHDLTTIGTTVGTVSYMSPEQARGEPVDARSDLFSLGSVLYEAATGELPFQGATSALIFVELLGKSPLPVRQHNSAVPRDLERFITRLLAKAPSDRFQSAKLALEALRGVSLRKSPFEGITLWASKATAKPRPEAPSLGDSPFLDKEITPGGRHSGDPVRPARRAETFSPSLPPYDRSPSPPAEPPNAARQGTAAMGGDLVIRPFKPDAARPLPTTQNQRLDETDEDSFPDLHFVAPPTHHAKATEPQVPSPGEVRGVAAHAIPAAPGRAGPSRPQLDSSLAPEEKDAVSGASARMAAATGSADVPGRRWGRLVIALLIPPAAAALAWYLTYRHQSGEPGQPVSIAIAGVQNGTGDASLANLLSTGLLFAAVQSPHLSVRSVQEYTAMLRAGGQDSSGAVSLDEARTAARNVHAEVLVLGTIRGQAAPFQLSLRLVDVATGKRLAEVSETAPSRDQMAGAVDRLTSELRWALGESHETVARTAVPLSREATSSIDALLAFASGADLEAIGKNADAVLAFQHAASLDPHFTEAWLQLSFLYREEHAEVAAAHAAAEARSSSAKASARTQALAQATYAVNAAGEYERATDLLNGWLASYPADLQFLNALSLAQWLQGRFSDAQGTAERASQISRLDPTATARQEMALIALGRPEAVGAIEARGRAAGVTHPDIATMAEAASVVGTEMLLPPSERPLTPVTAAGLLDAAGHFSEGSARWMIVMDAARAAPERISAAAYANASAALNRALAGECGSALSLAAAAQSLPSGLLATFRAGEAQALCGNLEGARYSLTTLTRNTGPASAAQAYLAPDLSATIAWKSGDPQTALRLLDGARQFDTVSLTAYLRGLVQIAAHQPQLSIVQFQAILSHRGPAALFDPEVYPLAQLGLGRAYAASGDLTNSSVAYGRFLELWSSADPNLAAVVEARSHAHL